MNFIFGPVAVRVRNEVDSYGRLVTIGMRSNLSKLAPSVFSLYEVVQHPFKVLCGFLLYSP